LGVNRGNAREMHAGLASGFGNTGSASNGVGEGIGDVGELRSRELAYERLFYFIMALGRAGNNVGHMDQHPSECCFDRCADSIVGQGKGCGCARRIDC
jgi:hypothetical protein